MGRDTERREMMSEKAVFAHDLTAILSEAFISSEILAAVLPWTGIRNACVTDLGYTY